MVQNKALKTETTWLSPNYLPCYMMHYLTRYILPSIICEISLKAWNLKGFCDSKSNQQWITVELAPSNTLEVWQVCKFSMLPWKAASVMIVTYCQEIHNKAPIFPQVWRANREFEITPHDLSESQ